MLEMSDFRCRIKFRVLTRGDESKVREQFAINRIRVTLSLKAHFPIRILTILCY